MALALLSGGVHGSAAAGPPSIDELQADVARQHAAFAARFDGPFVTKSVAETSTSESGKKRVNTKVETGTRRSGVFALMYTQNEFGGDPTGFQHTAQGINSQYFFKLARNRTDKEWLLQRVVPVAGRGKGDTESGVGELRQAIAALPTRLTKLKLFEGPTACDRFRSLPGFRLVSTGETGQRVRAAFEYDHREQDPKRNGRSRCEVEFDLDHHALPVHMAEELTGDNMSRHHTLDIQVVATADGLHLQVHGTNKMAVGGRTVYESETNTATDISFTHSPESAFTTSAFGLPEPPGVTWGRTTPLYIWLAGGGVVAAIAFVVLRQFAGSRPREDSR